ncbi:hypothetical protein D3C81_375910 [compost metagenome]
MLTLSFPKPTTAVYPRTRFADLGNLRRQTEYNRNAFINFVRSQPYNLENEHILVGLLQQLSINAEWDLQYVISWARFRAYTLCTMFKITSLNHVGHAQYNGFYREGVCEHWCLIENDRQYDESVVLEELSPVVPLCSTITKHSYTHTLMRDTTYNRSRPNEVAIMGVDIVELAIGWWLYQRMGYDRDTGIHAYLAQYPLVDAQLMHNQLAVINVLYQHVLHDVPLNDLITTDHVVFNTMNERRLRKLYLEHLVKFFSNRRLANFEHFLRMFDSVYAEPYFNYIRAGKNALFAQTSWVWEPALMKLYSLYLHFANLQSYKAADISTLIERSHGKRINNYQRIPETFFRGWFISLADEMNDLNNENLKNR